MDDPQAPRSGIGPLAPTSPKAEKPRDERVDDEAAPVYSNAGRRAGAEGLAGGREGGKAKPGRARAQAHSGAAETPGARARRGCRAPPPRLLTAGRGHQEDRLSAPQERLRSQPGPRPRLPTAVRGGSKERILGPVTGDPDPPDVDETGCLDAPTSRFLERGPG